MYVDWTRFRCKAVYMLPTPRSSNEALGVGSHGMNRNLLTHLAALC